MKKIIGILALIVVVATVSIFGYKTFVVDKPVEIQESGDSPVDPQSKLAKDVRIEAVNVNNKADHININNRYPSITSFKSKEFENYINKTIAGNIADYRNEINEIVDDYTLDVKQYSYITDFERYNWGSYLTLVIKQDYQTGGIRSNTWKEIYNIDVDTERIIYLEDIFRATVDYEDAIIAEITKQAKDRNIVLMGGDGLKKLPTKQKFYIRDGNLIMYFDPSEVAANKYGALEFEMPFEIDSEGYFEIAKAK